MIVNFFFLILQGFYDEVSNPMLIDVELNYPENEISDLTTNSFKHFYDGSEIVVAGRFVDNNQNHLSVDVRGEGVSMDFFDLCKISECIFYLHSNEQKCHVNVGTGLCSVVYTSKLPRNNGTKFLIQCWQFPGQVLCRTRLVFNFIRFSGLKVLIFGKFWQSLAAYGTKNTLTPNRLTTPCHTLHSKMLSKQLRLSKNNNTYLESTLKGSGLILPLNNSWKNGNYIWSNTLTLDPLHPLTPAASKMWSWHSHPTELPMGKHKNQWEIHQPILLPSLSILVSGCKLNNFKLLQV